MDGRASLSAVDDEDAAQRKHLLSIILGWIRMKRVWGWLPRGTTRTGEAECNVGTSIDRRLGSRELDKGKSLQRQSVDALENNKE
jgi:hypothetical protein